MDACHGCGREFGGIGAWLEPGARFHPAEAVSEVDFPAVEPGGDGGARLRVLLGELTGEGADRAAAAGLSFDLKLDEGVEPPVDPCPRVEVV